MNDIDAFEKRIQALEGIIPLSVKFRRMRNGASAPTRGTVWSAGWDLYAAEDAYLTGTGQTVLVPTGIALELPRGYEAQIRPRSSMNKRGILTHFGTIDGDYRGEIIVCLTSLDRMNYITHVRAGDRIAQLVLAPVSNPRFIEVDELSETERGTGGFGSTGR